MGKTRRIESNGTKALQTAMCNDMKAYGGLYEIEYNIANGTNRGRNVTQKALKQMFDRYGNNSDGCSKAVHLEYEGHEFNYIVVKRSQVYPYIPSDAHSSGNQLLDEVNCWLRFEDEPESDYLCPVLRHYFSKSDKVHPTSDKALDNSIIVAQKACRVGNMKHMCAKAEQMNNDAGYFGIDAETRFEQLSSFSESMGWRDAIYNPANCGVIYDYNLLCYKAVIIDYAL